MTSAEKGVGGQYMQQICTDFTDEEGWTLYYGSSPTCYLSNTRLKIHGIPFSDCTIMVGSMVRIPGILLLRSDSDGGSRKKHTLPQRERSL